MKIKLFVWLVEHKKILNWDNIRKRGILGPSRCQLCEGQEEIMEHLLNSCMFSSSLWDSFSFIFQQTDMDKNSICNTLTNWRKGFTDNEVLAIAWALFLSFIVWNVWKERNNQIFKEVKRTSQCIFELILKHLKETVSTIVRNILKNLPSGIDLRILCALGLQIISP